METGNWKFYPYKGQTGPVDAGGNEEFSIDLAEQPRDKDHVTVRTPRGSLAYIWLVETKGEFEWKIYLPGNDERIVLTYAALEGFWPRCEEALLNLRQIFGRKVQYEQLYSG